MNGNPKVSICIPTYNYAKYIAECIESVISQTYKDFELIIVDNCSVDNTEEIVKSYISSSNKVKYFCNTENIGMTANWNRCLELASGEYVKILCADDLLMPQCLQETMEVLNNNKNIVLLATARLLVDENLTPSGSLRYSNSLELEVGCNVIKKCLIYGNQIGEPSSVVFKRESSSRGFSSKYTQLTDLEMWFYILEQGDFYFLNEELCMFRQHKNQETKSNIKSLIFADEEFALLNDYVNKQYIVLTYIQMHLAKFNKSLILWNLKDSNTVEYLKQKISQHYNLYFFYALLSVQKLRNILRNIFRNDNARTH